MKSIITFLMLSLYTITAWSICDGEDRTFTLTDPTDNQIWNMQSQVYRSPVIPGQRNPVIFIMPPIIGANDLDRSLAIRFCLNGMNAFILNAIKDDPSELEPFNLKTNDEALLRTHAAIRAVITELSTEPDNNGNYGILGASLGGIQSAYIAGVEPLIKSSVVIAGAGNIPGILAYSDQERAVRVRTARMEKLRITDPQVYESLMTSFITEDPLNVAGSVPPNSMYIFTIMNDQSVPTVYQQQLAAAIPSPKVREIQGTHIVGIVEAGTVYGDDIADFFRERLR